MKEKEAYFLDLHKKIKEQKELYELSTLIFLIEEHLKTLTLKDINDTQKWIDDTIEMYYQEELENAIEKARYETDYRRNDNGEWEEYNKYFFRGWIKKGEGDFVYYEAEPEIDLIIQDFSVETREYEYDGDTLEWLLKTNFRDNGLVEGIEKYQIMSVMVLEYMERFINGDSLFGDGNKLDQNNLFRAFFSFISSQKIKAEYDLNRLVDKSKRDIAQKAAKARHKENREIKNMVISRWKKYQENLKESGKTISKTAFANKIFKELEKAHQKDPQKNKLYSIKTIRNNWLQGI
ncbi:hypothetical protein ACLSZ3_02585 [Avibacterium gallinarum]|uniref:hypothetical protein n=1 Tax=Avibacterium gallinarum TaxID=755 RepID=UPI003BF7FC06